MKGRSSRRERKRGRKRGRMGGAETSVRETAWWRKGGEKRGGEHDEDVEIRRREVEKRNEGPESWGGGVRRR